MHQTIFYYISPSALGFGAIRRPNGSQQAVSLLRRGIVLGISYVDTEPGYLAGESEVFVGRA